MADHGGRPRSLSGRVTLLVGVAVASVVALHGGLTYWLEERRFEAAVERDFLLLDALAGAARERLRLAIGVSDPTHLRDEVARLAREHPGLSLARVYDGEGNLLTSLPPPGPHGTLRTLAPSGPRRGVAELRGEPVAWLARELGAPATAEGTRLGYVLLGLSATHHVKGRWTAVTVAGCAGLLALAALSLALRLVFSRLLTRPLRTFAAGTRRVARGDLSQRFAEPEAGEVGDLARALNAMQVDLASQLRALGASALEVNGAADQLAEAARDGAAEARGQQALAQTTEEAAQAIGRQLRAATEATQALVVVGEGVSTSSAELQLALRELGRAAEQLGEGLGTVEDATAEEGERLGQVSLALTQLGAHVGASSELAARMDDTLRGVEATVRRALDLAVSVAERAARGREAVQHSRGGMEQIRGAFNVTVEGIGRLRDHSVQIGEVVHVLEGFAKQVNLLALNASIIASRSGEHGQSFGVVAAEIRGLAERTGVSVSQIADLVDRFQHDLEYCVSCMRQGREAVENGEGLAEEALAALGGLLASAQQSASLIAALAGTTLRQVDEGKRARELMTEVRERVGHLERLEAQQRAEGQRLVEATRHCSAAAHEVTRAAGAGGRGGLLAAQTHERCRELVRDATRIAAEQERLLARVGELGRSLQELAGRTLRHPEAVPLAAQDLQRAKAALAREVQKLSL